MRFLTALAVAVAAAAAPVAHAADPMPSGPPCQFETVALDGGDEYTGEMGGGPVTAPGSTVSLRCSIHVDNEQHSGPAVVEATATGHGVAVVEPHQVTATFPEDAIDSGICTEATVGTTTWYWTDFGTWTTDPAAACGDTLGWAIWTPWWTLPPELRPFYAYALTAVFCVSPVQFRTTCDLITPPFEWVDDLLP